MRKNELVRKYAKKVHECLSDPVAFSKTFLNFTSYPYQMDFMRDQSPRIVACCGRQVGKTTVTAIKAIHFALAHPSVTILIVSAGLRQSIHLFDKILNFIDVCLPAKALCCYRTRTKIRFSNGSEIIALPCGREGSTLRGYTADLVILDEANFIPKMVIDSVLRPTMITRTAQMIMISTPWTMDHPFYEAFNNPDLDFKIYTWPTHMNPQVTSERLELEKRTIGELAYDREYNARFLDTQFAYYSSDLVLNCTEDYELHGDPAPDQKYAGNFHIGIDFGKTQDHSAIAIVEKISETKIRLVYLKEFKLGTEYMDVINWVKTLNDVYQFRGGNLDQTGVGEGPYEQIRTFAPRIMGMKITAPVKYDVHGKLKLTLEKKNITLPRSNKTLLTQICSQQCKPLPSGNLQFTHAASTHDDQLWALALATISALKPEPVFRAIGVKRKF